MPADADAVGVADAGVHDRLHRGARAHDELLDVVIVRRVAADNRHLRVVEHGVTLRQEEEV